MTKWADYLISAVRFEGTHIFEVLLHTDTENHFGKGVRTKQAEVIKLLKSGKVIFTITWNYPDWEKGAKVVYEVVDGREILRTAPDNKQKNNLDNLIPLSII